MCSVNASRCYVFEVHPDALTIRCQRDTSDRSGAKVFLATSIVIIVVIRKELTLWDGEQD